LQLSPSQHRFLYYTNDLGFGPTSYELRSIAISNIGSDKSFADDKHNCDITYADDFCYQEYGGQLASVDDEDAYQKLQGQINFDTTNVCSDGRACHYLLGLYVDDETGDWTWTDGTDVDIDFLRDHSNDGLAGTTEKFGVYDPSSDLNSDKGLNDCCTTNDNSWNMDAFVCEFYAAPGSVVRCSPRERVHEPRFIPRSDDAACLYAQAIGTGRSFTDANNFCASE
jgi:hypothetical protein